MSKILVIGCGDIGEALATKLQLAGHQVVGMKRTPCSTHSPLDIITADVTDAKTLECLPFNVDQVVYILSPKSRDISAYKDVFKLGVDNVLQLFSARNPNVAFTFVSSTRVYGQCQGEWLNELSITEPVDERGRILLAAEHKFLAFNQATTIVRFSGIYGRSNYLLNQLKQGIEIQQNPPYYTNRIHRDDCIGVLDFIVNKKASAGELADIYLATDDDPAEKWEVAYYLAKQFGMDEPKVSAVNATADMNKRLSNKRLREAGYKFSVESYKQGYKKVNDEH